jgi:hypothetical protein
MGLVLGIDFGRRPVGSAWAKDAPVLVIASLPKTKLPELNSGYVVFVQSIPVR